MNCLSWHPPGAEPFSAIIRTKRASTGEKRALTLCDGAQRKRVRSVHAVGLLCSWEIWMVQSVGASCPSRVERRRFLLDGQDQRRSKVDPQADFARRNQDYRSSLVGRHDRHRWHWECHAARLRATFVSWAKTSIAVSRKAPKSRKYLFIGSSGQYPAVLSVPWWTGLDLPGTNLGVGLR